MNPPTLNRKIYVIVGASHEILSYAALAAFTDESAARALAADWQAKADAYEAEHTAWCNQRAPLYFELFDINNPKRRSIGVLTDEEEREIVRVIGKECPKWMWKDIQRDDSYTVCEVPLT